MPMYDFYGIMRISADSEEEAYNILDGISEIESFHIEEVREMEQ